MAVPGVLVRLSETWSVGEGRGGSAIVVQCKPLRGRESAARDFIHTSFGPGRMPALVRMSLWEEDNPLGAVFAPPAPGGAVRKGKVSASPASASASFAVSPCWVLLLETSDVARMALAVHDCLLGCESDKTGLLVGSWTRYQLIGAHDSAVAA